MYGLLYSKISDARTSINESGKMYRNYCFNEIGGKYERKMAEGDFLSVIF